MMTRTAIAMAATLCGVPAYSASALATAFNPDKEIPYKTVTGAKTEEKNTLKLELFLPESHDAAKHAPCIVFFFGGGWQTGGTRQLYPQAEYLAARGMVGICVWYRTKVSHQAEPFLCLEDAKSAMR